MHVHRAAQCIIMSHEMEKNIQIIMNINEHQLNYSVSVSLYHCLAVVNERVA